MSHAPPPSHPLSQETFVPAVEAVVGELLSGRLLRGSRARAERLARCLLKGPTPATLEALLARLYGAPPYGDGDLFGDETGAFALVRLTTRLFGAPHRLATVEGDLVVSGREPGAAPSPLLIPGNLKVKGSLRVDEGAWLLCTGDVEVCGSTLDDDPGSVIAAGGSLSTARMCTIGAVVVGGRLDVSDTLLAWRNDDRLVVEGGLRAGLLVAWGHVIDAAFEGGVRLDPETDEAVLRRHLRDDLFTAEAAGFDVEAADMLLRRNESPRRVPTPRGAP